MGLKSRQLAYGRFQWDLRHRYHPRFQYLVSKYVANLKQNMNPQRPVHIPSSPSGGQRAGGDVRDPGRHRVLVGRELSAVTCEPSDRDAQKSIEHRQVVGSGQGLPKADGMLRFDHTPNGERLAIRALIVNRWGGGLVKVM